MEREDEEAQRERSLQVAAAAMLAKPFSPMRTTPCRRYGWSGVEARGSTAVGGSEEHGGGGEAGHGWVFAAAGG